MSANCWSGRRGVSSAEREKLNSSSCRRSSRSPWQVEHEQKTRAEFAPVRRCRRSISVVSSAMTAAYRWPAPRRIGPAAAAKAAQRTGHISRSVSPPLRIVNAAARLAVAIRGGQLPGEAEHRTDKHAGRRLVVLPHNQQVRAAAPRERRGRGVLDRQRLAEPDAGGSAGAALVDWNEPPVAPEVESGSAAGGKQARPACRFYPCRPVAFLRKRSAAGGRSSGAGR